jgi:hypothetical protein
MKRAAAVEPALQQPESTGLPFLGSWKNVYLFVLGTFILWVAILVALTEIFA